MQWCISFGLIFAWIDEKNIVGQAKLAVMSDIYFHCFHILMEFIPSKSKRVHGLVRTDIQPKDRQNFSSRVKISRDEVLVALEDIILKKIKIIYLL